MAQIWFTVSSMSTEERKPMSSANWNLRGNLIALPTFLGHGVSWLYKKMGHLGVLSSHHLAWHTDFYLPSSCMAHVFFFTSPSCWMTHGFVSFHHPTCMSFILRSIHMKSVKWLTVSHTSIFIIYMIILKIVPYFHFTFCISYVCMILLL